MNKESRTRLIQLGLLVLTITTTTLAGTEWMLNKYVFTGMTWNDFVAGFAFSLPFLGILTVHEFGHYFTARHHRISVSLPYYIPLWLGFMLGPSIGTMGAFIRIRESIQSRLKYFDVGVSGPIAGFVIALFVLYYGFSNLPEKEYIYRIHPEYQNYETIDEAIAASEGLSIRLGGNLLFDFFKNTVADPEKIPHPNELIHYPILFAGYLALFFTALNLLPIGQLDGGHVVFGLFGSKRHGLISRSLFTLYVLYASLGWVTIHDLQDLSLGGLTDFLISVGLYIMVVYIASYSVFRQRRDRLLYATVLLTVQFFINAFTGWVGYQGWLLFAVLLGRFLGVDHPPVVDNRPLGIGRQIVGWIALIIFVISFSPEPLVIELPEVPDTP